MASMPKRALETTPTPLQAEAGGPLPRTLRETYAEALKKLERELRDSQAALASDDSEANRARYARALFEFDQVAGMFPFVAAGAGDAQA